MTSQNLRRIIRGVHRVHSQGSIDVRQKFRPDDDSPSTRKVWNNNAIDMLSALQYIEKDDDAGLQSVLRKSYFNVNTKLICGPYAEYSRKWTLLDVALNLRSTQCVRSLQNFGAKENLSMNSIEKRKVALDSAATFTCEQIAKLASTEQTKEVNKVGRLWSAHLLVLERMARTLSTVQLPDPPEFVKVESNSRSSVLLHVECARERTEPVIKYMVEWSTQPDFSKILGGYVETDMRKGEVIVTELPTNTKLCFRVSCGGILGYSSPTLAQPMFVELSSWYDVAGKPEGWNEHMESMSKLGDDVTRYRQSPVWKTIFSSSEETVKKKKNSLKEFFMAGRKFSKSVTRGIYLGSVLYTDGKVLCTSDDCLPLIHVDNTVTTIANDDFLWLMKMSLCWEEVGTLSESVPGDLNIDKGLR
ncbi:unnamed protein product [Cylicocyclus nassatus]|uniref:Fibronectin type-III domain-containing protein n=1 Tax=Cylicocyclus nassatus TaxID=53992 RepID=A0AA36MI70_CYLNA|nr:unnamed protein product [Cylicocyclus nassatus]